MSWPSFTWLGQAFTLAERIGLKGALLPVVTNGMSDIRA